MGKKLKWSLTQGLQFLSFQKELWKSMFPAVEVDSSEVHLTTYIKEPLNNWSKGCGSSVQRPKEEVNFCHH